MLTNGFALFRGEGAPEAAREAAGRVHRRCERVEVDAGDGFEELARARLSGKRELVLAYSFEHGGDFPLVHGFLEGSKGSSVRGEFSILRKVGDRFVGVRDPLGTRGLWSTGGSLATDYRLLEGDLSLVKPPRARRDGQRKRPVGFLEAAKKLADLVETSVKMRVSGRRKVAVSFSGGLDSSLLALVASRYSEVVLCSAFAKGALDERQTSKAAELLDLGLEVAVIDERSLQQSSPELPPGEATAMDAALWCIYSSTSRLAKESGAGTILLGQLADELFGGYRKYALRAKEDGPFAAESMMRRDVRACAERGFPRDEAACSRWAEVRFPYADAGISALASGLPLEYKIRGEERKAVLRAAALELGLPEELAGAPKKAAQFSSGVAKLVKRQPGF